MQGLKRTFFIVSIATGSFCSAQKFNTPEAYSFQQEVFRPISYYTGQANISIPLFNIQTNEITIPVTLNYVGGGGLRAINPYSSVGLGWRLTAGGVITRSKNGACDEIATYDGAHLKGFFSLPANTVSNSTVRNNVSSYVAISPDIHVGQYFSLQTEYSPDVFSFSFLGYSGYFLMGYDGKFKIQSQDIDSVAKTSLSNWPGSYNTVYFTLFAKDGTKYTFGSNTGSIEISGGNAQAYYPHPVTPAQSDAWYLTSIESANGRVISFYYKDNSNNYVYYTPSTESNDVYANRPVMLESIQFNE